MLESLVVSILNRFLKNYVSNLNYDQLNIGIWQGKKEKKRLNSCPVPLFLSRFSFFIGQVNLRNLKLRKDALDKLHLPINVSEGIIR